MKPATKICELCGKPVPNPEALEEARAKSGQYDEWVQTHCYACGQPLAEGERRTE